MARATRRSSTTTPSSTRSRRPRRSRCSTTSAGSASVDVVDNLLAGGGYVMYGGAKNGTGNVTGPILIKDNRIARGRQDSHGYYPNGGEIGLWAEFNKAATKRVRQLLGRQPEGDGEPRQHALLTSPGTVHGLAPADRGHHGRVARRVRRGRRGRSHGTVQGDAARSHDRPGRQARRAGLEVQALPLPLAATTRQEGPEARQRQGPGAAASLPDGGREADPADRYRSSRPPVPEDQAAAGPTRSGRRDPDPAPAPESRSGSGGHSAAARRTASALIAAATRDSRPAWPARRRRRPPRRSAPRWKPARTCA